MMTVAVENGLDQVAAYLHRSGCHVVPAGHFLGEIDALVYRDCYTPGMLSDANYPTEQDGVLMVSAFGKTPEQIHDVLQTRVYSPLF